MGNKEKRKQSGDCQMKFCMIQQWMIRSSLDSGQLQRIVLECRSNYGAYGKVQMRVLAPNTGRVTVDATVNGLGPMPGLMMAQRVRNPITEFQRLDPSTRVTEGRTPIERSHQYSAIKPTVTTRREIDANNDI